MCNTYMSLVFAGYLYSQRKKLVKVSTLKAIEDVDFPIAGFKGETHKTHIREEGTWQTMLY